MAGRYSDRRIDGEQGRYDRRFREMRNSQVGQLQAAPGSTVTIEQIMSDPNGTLSFINTDETVAIGPGDLSLTLSFVPIVQSEHVYWNGISQRPEDWTRVGNVLTFLDPDSIIQAGDGMQVAYAVDVPANTTDGGGSDSHYFDTVMSDAPIGYYRLGENSGSTMVDSSGFARDGTYTSVTLGTPGLITGDEDTAGTFDGSASQGVVPYGAWATSQTLSIDAWIKPSSVTGGHVILARHADPEASFIFRVKDGLLEFVAWTGSGGVGVATTQSDTTLVTGTRYHVAVRVASNSVNFFLNGIADGTGALTGSVYTGTADLEVGVDGVGTEHFAGVLDEVAFYDTYLSDARIAAHYSAGV